MTKMTPKEAEEKLLVSAQEVLKQATALKKRLDPDNEKTMEEIMAEIMEKARKKKEAEIMDSVDETINGS